MVANNCLHCRYVDLLLGEFKHYKTRLVHGGINKEVKCVASFNFICWTNCTYLLITRCICSLWKQTQDILLQYGLENVAEVLVEGLSRIKRCTDEGRALMSLDLQVREQTSVILHTCLFFTNLTHWVYVFLSQVLINGLQHFAPANVRPKFQIVEAFIKVCH